MEKNEKSILKSKFFSFFSNKKTLVMILACVLIAVLLFTLSNRGTKNNSEATNETTNTVTAYSKMVSNELENILSAVSGISNAKVLVVVESTPVKKYLTASDEVVLKKSGSSSSPVELCEVYPKITGVLIIAKGTTNLKVKNDILNAISAVYGVDISKIDILEGK